MQFVLCNRPGESSSEKNCYWWLFSWLRRCGWLPLRLLKRQSPTTFLFRTTFTRTINQPLYVQQMLKCEIRAYFENLHYLLWQKFQQLLFCLVRVLCLGDGKFSQIPERDRDERGSGYARHCWRHQSRTCVSTKTGTWQQLAMQKFKWGLKLLLELNLKVYLTDTIHI